MRLFSAILLLLTATITAAEPCSKSDIKIKNVNFSFMDDCMQSSCPMMRGAATIVNNCSQPTGVKLKYTAFNSEGQAIAVKDGWPAITKNIPPGDHPISLDYKFDYTPELDAISIVVTEVKQWKKR